MRECSKKLKWYALCPVVDALNHSSLVEVRLLQRRRGATSCHCCRCCRSAAVCKGTAGD